MLIVHIICSPLYLSAVAWALSFPLTQDIVVKLFLSRLSSTELAEYTRAGTHSRLCIVAKMRKCTWQ